MQWPSFSIDTLPPIVDSCTFHPRPTTASLQCTDLNRQAKGAQSIYLPSINLSRVRGPYLPQHLPSFHISYSPCHLRERTQRNRDECPLQSPNPQLLTASTPIVILVLIPALIPAPPPSQQSTRTAVTVLVLPLRLPLHQAQLVLLLGPQHLTDLLACSVILSPTHLRVSSLTVFFNRAVLRATLTLVFRNVNPNPSPVTLPTTITPHHQFKST